MWITYSLESMFHFSQVSAGWHFPVFHWKRSDMLDSALVLAPGQNSQYGQQWSGSWGNPVSLTLLPVAEESAFPGVIFGWTPEGFRASWSAFGCLGDGREWGRFLFFLSCVFCLKLLWADQGYARSHGLTIQKWNRCAVCFKFRNCSGNWY